MSSAPLTAQAPSSCNGEPASPPAQWLWDFPLRTEEMAASCESDGATKVSVVEYWNYEDDSPVRLAKIYAQDQIAQHLKRPIPLRGGKVPSTGFQIAMVVHRDQMMPPLGMSLLNEMSEALGLPNYHRHYSSALTGALGIFLLPDNNWVFVRQRQSDRSSIGTVFRYNPQTNITRGIIYSDLRIPELAFISEFEQCPHPLLPPLLALEITLDMNVSYLVGYKSTLYEMEETSGYALRFGDNEEANALDYRAMVKSLSQARSGIYIALGALRLTHTCVKYILTKLSFVDDRLSPVVRDRLRESSRTLQERAEYIASVIEHALDGAEKERLNGMHGTLLNLITQNDTLLSTSLARDSRAIAAASKRDSSSMKIIAVLTTFFLPGTFIATFFSMPLFDWDTESIMHVANRHFWIFWAVTAPLTVSTMACVAGWAFWHSRNTRNMDLRERENFSQVVADEAQRLKRAATMRTAASSSRSVV